MDNPLLHVSLDESRGSMYVRIREGRVDYSNEIECDVIADFDCDNQLLGVELLDLDLTVDDVHCILGAQLDVGSPIVSMPGLDDIPLSVHRLEHYAAKHIAADPSFPVLACLSEDSLHTAVERLRSIGGAATLVCHLDGTSCAVDRVMLA